MSTTTVRRLAIALSLVLVVSVCNAEDWTTTDGKAYQDVKVVSHDDAFVNILDSNGGARIPLRLLNPALQQRFNYDPAKALAAAKAAAAQDQAEVQANASARGTRAYPRGFSPLSSAPPYRTAPKPVAAAPANAPAVTAVTPPNDNPLSGLKLDEDEGGPTSDAPPTFLGKFSGHLVVLNQGHTKPADRTLLDGVKFIAFYYSASWCAPCRAFTPKLVTFYQNFKAAHPNFELIFVDRDDSEDDMLAYMDSDKMTWPAVRFDDIESPRLRARQFEGPGIPCLVLVNDQGKVLADSYINGEYYGPDQVVDAIMKMVPFPPAAAAAAAEPTVGP